MAGTVAVRERSAPTTFMQGVAVPAESVDPGTFFKLTRRHSLLERQFPYSGQPTETIELRKSDILSGLTVRFTGQVVITGGTAKTSARWPYDFITAKFTANGASNIINCGGLKLKIRDIMKSSDLTDRGVLQKIANGDRTQGTLARASEEWGVGSQMTGVAAGTYPIELEWTIPVAEDDIDLMGAIFLQSPTADLTLTLDLLPVASLIAAETATNIALTGNFQVHSTKYSIPVVGPGIVVPDLSMFHSLIQSRQVGLQNGENETRIIGQGAGKSLLRAYYQVYNGAGFDHKPLAMSTTNFGAQSWRFANNETPETYVDGRQMRIDQERRYNSDVGAYWGVGCWDFAYENVFRDAVDMGTTSELRLINNIQSGVTLTGAALEYVTETMFRSGTV